MRSGSRRTVKIQENKTVLVPEESATSSPRAVFLFMKKVVDLTIVYGVAELTKQWYASEERREHFLAYARGVWEKSGEYNAEEMVKKVIDHQCSPFELVGTYFRRI